MNRFRIESLAIAFILLISLVINLVFVLGVEPFGASVSSVGTPERAPQDSAQSIQAQAGNVTELVITGFSITQSWQGYYGNVSGTIQLADASDDVLYNWTLASPEGEIYAANQTVNWLNIQCLNFTANGSLGDESATRGAVSLAGINLTSIESFYTIAYDDVDGVNETFTLQHGGAGQHDLFYVNNLQFSEGECISTRLFGDTGTGVNNEFEEVLLYDPNNRIPVFTTLLDEDLLGFDQGSHDFEMIVLEDGHGTDVSSTTYYFYVEIE